MKTRFEHVAIIGAGLLGGSLGLGLKTRGMAGRITGAGHRQSSLDTALRVGAIDEATLDPVTAVKNADLVVLCTPVARLMDLLDVIRGQCEPEAVVTDVASTKRALCEHARASWPKPRRFVGSHPMAGSEKFGPEHARPDFYENSVCLVETADDLDRAARDKVVALWESLGARVIDIDPERHDEVLARTSHLPHVLASALAALAARQGDIRDLIGNGFRDATRIAASRPEIWAEICATNHHAILDVLAEYERDLDVFRVALANQDAEAIVRFFEDGRRARQDTVDG